MWQTDFRQSPIFIAWNRRLNSRQGWALRTAMLVAIVVVVIPCIVLVLAAMAIGMATFIVLSIIVKVMDVISPPRHESPLGAETPDVQRRNVRVIQDEV